MLTSKKDHQRAHSLIHSTPMVQVKQDGHPAVTKRYTHCERRYGQYDWDVSSSASHVVSRKVSGVQTASAPGTSAVLAARWARVASQVRWKSETGVGSQQS
jgi:hypothetical protein